MKDKERLRNHPRLKGGKTDIKKKKKTNMKVNRTCNPELDAGPGHQWGNE